MSREAKRILLGALALVVLLVVAVAVFRDPPPTCADLSAEIATMTGPDATVDYDADRVREINAERDRQGCAP